MVFPAAGTSAPAANSTPRQSGSRKRGRLVSPGGGKPRATRSASAGRGRAGSARAPRSPSAGRSPVRSRSRTSGRPALQDQPEVAVVLDQPISVPAPVATVTVAAPAPHKDKGQAWRPPRSSTPARVSEPPVHRAPRVKFKPGEAPYVPNAPVSPLTFGAPSPVRTNTPESRRGSPSRSAGRSPHSRSPGQRSRPQGRASPLRNSKPLPRPDDMAEHRQRSPSQGRSKGSGKKSRSPSLSKGRGKR